MIDAAVRERSDALVKTLLDSVRIASVSLTGEGIQDQVGFLKKRLEAWGFAVEVHPTTSHPIVYAEIGPKDASFTWLLYGHYDVYPADEKQEGWRTKPFEPVVEGDRVWGRGTGDNKGQHLAMLNATPLDRELTGGAADRREGDPGGRRGDRIRAAAEIHRGESRAAEGGSLRVLRRADVPE